MIIRPNILAPKLFRAGLLSQPLLTPRNGTVTIPTLTPTVLTSGVATNGVGNIGTSTATASIAPGSNRVLYACCFHAVASAAASTATGNGLTWEAVNSQAIGTARIMTVFRAMGAAPSAGAVTFDFGVATPNSAAWIIVEFVGADTSGTNGSGATVQSVKQATGSVTSFTNSLAALGSASNVHLAFIGTRGVSAAISPDADFAELADVTTTSDALTLEAQWAKNQTDVTPSWSLADLACAISIEVKQAV